MNGFEGLFSITLRGSHAKGSACFKIQEAIEALEREIGVFSYSNITLNLVSKFTGSYRTSIPNSNSKTDVLDGISEALAVIESFDENPSEQKIVLTFNILKENVICAVIIRNVRIFYTGILIRDNQANQLPELDTIPMKSINASKHLIPSRNSSRHARVFDIDSINRALDIKSQQNRSQDKLKRFNAFLKDEIAGGEYSILKTMTSSTGQIKDPRTLRKYLDKHEIPEDGEVFRATIRGDANQPNRALLYDSEFNLIRTKVLID